MCGLITYLVTPGQKQDFGVGLLSGRGHFDDDGLHHHRAVREVLDGVTFQHAAEQERKGERMKKNCARHTRFSSPGFFVHHHQETHRKGKWDLLR